MRLLIPLLAAFALTILVGQQLRWDKNPNFMFQELYGLGYNHHCILGDLCNPSPFAGLAGQTSNVTDQRCLSLLYTLPNKVLGAHIDLYTLHRTMGVIFYCLVLLCLAWALWHLALHPLLNVALLVHYGLSAQLISLLYEAKLTLSSATWLAAAFLMIILLHKSTQRPKASFILPLLLPLLSALAYETYTVARVLALANLAFALVWFLCAAQFRLRRGITLLAFLMGCALAWSALTIVHPGITFDRTMLEGRTESLVSSSGEIAPDWKEIVMKRVAELPALWAWPNYYFSSESLAETGWRDVWIALLVVLALLAASLLRRGPELRQVLSKQFWILSWIVMIMGVALLVPLGSSTFVRGHRLFGLYMSSTLLLVCLMQILLANARAWMRSLILMVALGSALLTLWHRVPLVLAWQPPAHFTPDYMHDLLKTLEEYQPDPQFLAKPYSALIAVCDKSPKPDWEHAWNSVLYVTGLGCKLGGYYVRLSCECDQSLDNPANLDLVCLQREIVGGRNKIELRKAMRVSNPILN